MTSTKSFSAIDKWDPSPILNLHDEHKHEGCHPLKKNCLLAELKILMRKQAEQYNQAAIRNGSEQPLLRMDYEAAGFHHVLFGFCDVARACDMNPIISLQARLSSKCHLVVAQRNLKRLTNVELTRSKLQDAVQTLKNHPEANKTLIVEAEMALAQFEGKQRAKSNAHHKEWPGVPKKMMH